jgi:hypothetical protein
MAFLGELGGATSSRANVRPRFDMLSHEQAVQLFAYFRAGTHVAIGTQTRQDPTKPAISAAIPTVCRDDHANMQLLLLSW